MSRLEAILSKMESQEGLTIEYNGKRYFRPYQTFTVDGVTIEGLREMTLRKSLFDSLIHNIPKKAYLDVGSNMGYFPAQYSKTFKSVDGVEFNKHFYDLALDIYPFLSGHYHNIDLNKKRLPEFLDRKYNLITSLSMIEYINDKPSFVKDIYSLLEDGGICIFEGHSLDINNGLDLVYEKIIKAEPWSVERLKEKTDAGLNAPSYSMLRPVWVCRK